MNYLRRRRKSVDLLPKRMSIIYSIQHEFREKLKDVLTEEYTDEILCKWLRAKSFVLPKAEFLFRQHLAFRHVFECDKIREEYEPPEVIKKYAYSGFLGFAKDGTSLRYVPLGEGDIIGQLMSLSMFDLGRYFMWIIECDLAAMKESNQRGSTIFNCTSNNEITYIFDMNNYSLKENMQTLVIEVVWELLRLLQHLYPEIWKRVIIVNVSSFYDTLYNLFKPIIKTSLKEKLCIVTKEDTTQELLKYVDENVLPAFLGGKRVDSNGDPRCSEFISFGGKVPKSYYLLNQKQLLIDEPGVECIEIPSRRAHNYSVVIHEAGSSFQLEIRSLEGAVSLALLYKRLNLHSKNYGVPTKDEILEEKNPKSGIYSLCPSFKVQLHLTPMTCSFFCPWPGIYIYKMDNTFSWLQSKKILLKKKVFPPKSSSPVHVQFPYRE